MEDKIGKTITSVAGEILPLYRYEASEDGYPYGVFFYSPEYYSSKDGVYKLEADVTVQVYSQDFDDALAKDGAIRAAIISGMNSGEFRSRVSTSSRECVEGVWNIETVYKITQLSE